MPVGVKVSNPLFRVTQSRSEEGDEGKKPSAFEFVVPVKQQWTHAGRRAPPLAAPPGSTGGQAEGAGDVLHEGNEVDDAENSQGHERAEMQAQTARGIQMEPVHAPLPPLRAMRTYMEPQPLNVRHIAAHVWDEEVYNISET